MSGDFTKRLTSALCIQISTLCLAMFVTGYFETAPVNTGHALGMLAGVCWAKLLWR